MTEQFLAVDARRAHGLREFRDVGNGGDRRGERLG